MGKIVNTERAVEISKELKNKGKSIVLAGGCFDLLHIGHLVFLEKAKKQGDVLFILLESDQTIEKIKGRERPINTQKDRARLLAGLTVVDYVITLPELKTNQDYDNLILSLKPNIIATTKGDPALFHKKRQAKLVRGSLLSVTQKISKESTTRLAELVSKEL